MNERNIMGSVLHRITDGIIALDNNWEYVFANEPAAQLAGVEVEDMIGKSIWEVFPEAVGTQVYEEYHEAIESQEEQHLEVHYEPMDMWFENRIYPSGDGLTIIFSNITERKKAAEKLDKATRKLRLLEQFLEHSDDAFQVAFEDGTLFYINEEASQRLGIKKESVSKYKVSDFEVLFKNPQDWQDHVDELKEKESVRIESDNVNQKTGKKIHVEVQVRYEVIEGTGYVIAISRDISRAEKAEKRLKDQQLLTGHMLNSVRDGISIVDLNGVHIDVNDSLCEMTGFSKNELLGCAPPHLYWPDDHLDEIQNAFEATLSGNARDFELTFKKKSGELFPVLINPSPILDQNGEISGYIATIKDISQLKEQQEKIRVSEEKFRSVLESSGLGFWDYDLKTNTTERTLAHDRCFGADSMFEKWNLEIFLNFIHPEDRDRVLSSYEEVEKKGVKYSEEFRVIWEDGTLHWLHTAGKAMRNEKGEIVRVIGITENITERKLNEIRVQQSVEEKNTLLAEIHHRVKNNLAVVSALMQLHVFETDNEEVEERLNSSINRVKSIALIHEELYKSNSFSEIALNKNIRDLMQNISGIYDPAGRVKVGYNLQEVKVSINKALPCALIVNEILTNVYKHAFSGEGGEIAIDLSENEDGIRLRVSDNGTGLPEEVLQNESGASSMGFNLMYSLAEQLDGTISFENDGGLKVELAF